MQISDLMETSGVRFGTSGARGLAAEMTDEVCYAYTLAFLQHLEALGEIEPAAEVSIGGDLRPSTDRIMSAVAQAVADRGYRPHNCGKLPSPALCLWGLERGRATIMVTGSHIPEERNGIKYTKKEGEILKSDEAAIKSQSVELPAEKFDEKGMLRAPAPLPPADGTAIDRYVARYLRFFPQDLLKGLRVGVYQHSAVGRDIVTDVCRRLGAEVVELGRSERFVAVDTEAIRPEDVELAETWARERGLDAIVSTDGDSDRPLVADERGKWFRGDVAGILCAAQLGADAVVVPVSCNTAVEKCGWFRKVVRTRIGSPYVIEAMQQLDRSRTGRVVGYEANGGFLIQTPIERDGKTLPALPTRDSLVVLLSVIERARQKKVHLSALRDELPRRFTASDRLKNFPRDASARALARFSTGDTGRDLAEVEREFGNLPGKPVEIDYTDGVRITFSNGEIVHLRPSGNAPEFRCYTEADSESRAVELNRLCLEIMEGWR
ncbi:MAG: phosphomannomutase [Deltaproteobacteria bacterium]|nr:MAG: phosphomannomutase [Deltaproteobacteria bacterium]